MADGTLKVGTITNSAGSGNIAIGSGVTLLSNVPAFEAFLSATDTISDATATKVEFDTKVFDTDNCYDNSTNYRFTPTVAGKYYVYSSLEIGSDTNTALDTIAGYIYKNGINYSSLGKVYNANYIRRSVVTLSSIIDMNGTTDYLEMFTYIDVTSGTPTIFIDGARTTKFGAYRIGA